jgi:hypothetical protein
MLAAVEPPLGFRQIQALNFSNWKGERDAPAYRSLLASLKRAGADASAPAAAPPQKQPPAAPSAGRRRPFIAVGAAALGIAAISLLFLLPRDRQPTSDRASAAPIAPAVAALGASERPEDRAAYQSFVAGDRKKALAMLERLALDLERRGDKSAAAEAYTRAAAVALLIDPARGLAARRKAFELDPESIAVFQGLFFDIGTMKGWDAAIEFADETAASPAISERARAAAYAHIALLAIDAGRGAAAAEEYLQRVRTIRVASGDREIELMDLWAAGFVDWRQDRLDSASAKVEAGRRLAEDIGSASEFPDQQVDVMGPRIDFSRGDWSGALKRGAAALEERKKRGGFLPWPLFNTTCFSGLFAGEVEAAAPYCVAGAALPDRHGGAWPKLILAQLSAARGDLDEARIELAASRALAPGAPDIEARASSSTPRSPRRTAIWTPHRL